MTGNEKDRRLLGELADAGYAVQFGPEAVFGYAPRWVSRTQARHAVAVSGWPDVRRGGDPDGVSPAAWALLQRLVLAWADLPDPPAPPPRDAPDRLVRLAAALADDLPPPVRPALPPVAAEPGPALLGPDVDAEPDSPPRDEAAPVEVVSGPAPADAAGCADAAGSAETAGSADTGSADTAGSAPRATPLRSADADRRAAVERLAAAARLDLDEQLEDASSGGAARFAVDAAVAVLCDHLVDTGWVDPVGLAGAVEDFLVAAVEYRAVFEAARRAARGRLRLVATY